MGISLSSNVLPEDLFRNNIPRWQDLTFPAASINPSGSATGATFSPDQVAFVFVSTGIKSIGGSFQLPHSWQVGSALKPHIHWGCSNSDSGTVFWQLEYLWREADDPSPFDFGAWTTITSLAPAHGTAYLHKLASLPTISGAGFSRSSVLLWRLSRNADEATDTYGGSALLWAFDVHYLVENFGSLQEYGD